MLTMDAATLAGGGRAWVTEFDTEHGHVQVYGPGEVAYHPARPGGEAVLESAATGGCYTGPQVIGEVQIWNAEEHYLAVFPDEASMRAGGRQLAEAFGDALPAGIHRVLAAGQS